MSKTRLLLVDDDRQVLESMDDWLSGQGYLVETCSDYDAAVVAVERGGFHVLLTDLRLGLSSGLELLKVSRRIQPEVPVILLSGYATLETGVEAIRGGAFDLLTKPLIDETLQDAISRALLGPGPVAESKKPPQKPVNTNVIGESKSLQETFDVIHRVADTKATVLVTGESGTGKSLIAREIHKQSSRSEQPFVEVACGALSDTLLESELFGHVAGAFTGAVADKVGKFARADGGTLFLDEILTASPRMQVKLLRVMQEFEFEAVGDTKTRKVDTRVILATNENLPQAVRDGRFRQDLYYRINVINLELPPLRKRGIDIPELCSYFLKLVCQETGKTTAGFSDEALTLMQNYDWPGNVRELQNVVQRAVLLGGDDLLESADLPPELREPNQSMKEGYCHGQTLKEALEQPEREIIRQVLEAFDGNRNRTADSLGINRTTLYKKMKRLGLDADPLPVSMPAVPLPISNEAALPA
ncbi:MAG: sigma-54 dependent transcriptional regulator [Pirellulaceae bacterium]